MPALPFTPTGGRVEVRLAFSQRVERAAYSPVLAASHQQFLRRELGDDLAAVRRHDDLLLDPRGRPAVPGRPVRLEREHHPLLERLGMIERDQPAEDRFLPY